jgi:alcohol dehydrogenase (NADP+)
VSHHLATAVAFEAGGEMIPKNAAGVAKVDKSVTISETYAAMEALLASGKTRNIGISNFTRSEVEELLKTAKVKPSNIQLELHRQCTFSLWEVFV